MNGRNTLILSLILLGHGVAIPQTNHSPEPAHPCCRSLAASAPVSDRSIYQLTSDWVTDSGNTTKLAALRGKPQVVAMFFASCQGACPILVHEMQSLKETFPAGTRTNVGFVLVTFDPEKDTPDALRAYRASRHLADGQWTILRGRPEDAQELALVLGVKYRRETNGQFSHSNLITILNAAGEIAYQQNGLGGDNELSKHLNLLLKP